MASDLVQDLELDQAPDDIDFVASRVSEERMIQMRAYLAAYHLCSSFSASWQKPSSIHYQEWTATCCKVLERGENGQTRLSDQVLAWLVRLDHLAEETLALANRRRGQTMQEEHILLMTKGLEAQFEEWRIQIPAEAGSQRKRPVPNPNSLRALKRLVD